MKTTNHKSNPIKERLLLAFNNYLHPLLTKTVVCQFHTALLLFILLIVPLVSVGQNFQDNPAGTERSGYVVNSDRGGDGFLRLQSGTTGYMMFNEGGTFHLNYSNYFNNSNHAESWKHPGTNIFEYEHDTDRITFRTLTRFNEPSYFDQNVTLNMSNQHELKIENLSTVSSLGSNHWFMVLDVNNNDVVRQISKNNLINSLEKNIATNNLTLGADRTLNVNNNNLKFQNAKLVIGGSNVGVNPSERLYVDGNARTKGHQYITKTVDVGWRVVTKGLHASYQSNNPSPVGGVNSLMHQNGFIAHLDGKVFISNPDSLYNDDDDTDDGFDAHLDQDYAKDANLWVEGNTVTGDMAIVKPETADFVFEDTYNLPTLNFIENHIKDKGHLHTMPSAEDMVENGYTVANINQRFLITIEELTLHTIAQNKKIKEQDEKIKTIEAHLASQEALLLQYQTLVKEMATQKASLGNDTHNSKKE